MSYYWCPRPDACAYHLISLESLLLICLVGLQHYIFITLAPPKQIKRDFREIPLSNTLLIATAQRYVLGTRLILIEHDVSPEHTLSAGLNK